MKALVGLLAWQVAISAAADHTFVVLNRSEQNSLVRVAPDGGFIATIANGAGGVGITKDSSGDYIVAAVHSLLRVTSTGNVTAIAKARKSIFTSALDTIICCKSAPVSGAIACGRNATRSTGCRCTATASPHSISTNRYCRSTVDIVRSANC